MRSTRTTSLAMVVAATVLIAGARPGLAQPSTAHTAPSAATDDWQRAFEAAQALMMHGQLSQAAPRFEALAARATSDVSRALAVQNAVLCRHWLEQGVRLQFPRGEMSVRADAPHRRTTGELASLYVSAVLYGIGSGAALAVHTKPDSKAGAVLPALAVSGASTAAIFWLDATDHFGYGVPQSISTGLSLGLLEGMAWTFWRYSSVRNDDEWSDKTMAKVLWGSATAGAVLGGVIGDHMGTTPGRAAFIDTTARWSALTAGLAFAAISADSHKRDDAGFLAGAVGLTAGAVGGYFIGEAESPSAARARFLDLGGLSGGLLAGGLFVSIDDELNNDRAFLLTAAAGMAGGVALSYVLTRNMDRDELEPDTGTVLSSITPTIAPSDQGGLTLGVGGAF